MPQIVHWNPRRRLGRSGLLRRVPLVKREDNFGDLLGPLIVERICHRLKLGEAVSKSQRLATVGSIINVVARDGDIIWGSGIHGNYLPLNEPFPKLDIRAVRGPLTATLLRQSGNTVPDVFGDPALLIPYLWSDPQLGIDRGTGGTVYVPNYYDIDYAPPNSLNPRGDVFKRVRIIASAERVVASSLHGIVIAEAYGIPAVLVASRSERLFKYEDYYGGTGREVPEVASNWESALSTRPASPLTTWDPSPLLESFPSELWSK